MTGVSGRSSESVRLYCNAICPRALIPCPVCLRTCLIRWPTIPSKNPQQQEKMNALKNALNGPGKSI